MASKPAPTTPLQQAWYNHCASIVRDVTTVTERRAAARAAGEPLPPSIPDDPYPTFASFAAAHPELAQTDEQ